MVWIRPGTDPYAPKYMQVMVKHPNSMMAWGDFRYQLVLLPRNVTVNEDCYLELLARHLDNCLGHCQSNMFQEDSALANTSELMKDWLKCFGVDHIKDWPGYCPDHNPIENTWGLRGRIS